MQGGVKQSSTRGVGAPSRREQRPGPRSSRKGAVIGALLIGCVAAISFWAYPRYLSGNKTCVLTMPVAASPSLAMGVPQTPIPLIPGQLARLDDPGNPLKFTALPRTVELRGVHYEGGSYGRFVVPASGAIAGIKIEGKDVRVRHQDIASGCLDVVGFGKILVLFTKSASPNAVVVMTQDQLAGVR